MKIIIRMQIKPSVGILPLVFSESFRKSFTDCTMTLLLLPGGLVPTNISCKKGISIPIEMIEKMMLSKMNRK